jgi:serine/threonine-protein kinase
MPDPSNNTEEGQGGEAVLADAKGERDLLATLREGALIEGKHRIDRIIGRGGMGVVAAATHIHLQERVALKFLQVKDEEVGGDFRARFALEARVCAKLRNEHIARVHDVGIWESKVPFMVMEYLEGVDLRRLLKDGAKLPLTQSVDYVVQICEGLAEAHAQGIVHRDLKPPNIFITRRPDGTELVKVLDFGISKWTTQEEDVGELTKTGMMLGSPKYMSPEQLNGGGIDARADVWSIGTILYQMLTGRPPYDFPQVTQTFMAIAAGAPPAAPSTFEPSIPPAVDALILRCLTRDKDKRVQNVAELAGALLEAVESPFAGQVRSQIGAVLEPSVVMSNRSGPLSLTTGSYAVFSLGNTGASLRPDANAARDPSMPAPVAPKSRGSAKTWAGVGAAVAALAFIGFTRSPRASESAHAGRAPDDVSARSVAPAVVPVVASVAPPVSATPPPAAPAAVVAPVAVHSAPPAVHAPVAPPARAWKHASVAPPPEASAAASAPSAHAPASSAAPVRKVDPLDDRQ